VTLIKQATFDKATAAIEDT